MMLAMQCLSKEMSLEFDMPNLELLALLNNVPGWLKAAEFMTLHLHFRSEHLLADCSRIVQYFS